MSDILEILKRGDNSLEALLRAVLLDSENKVPAERLRIVGALAEGYIIESGANVNGNWVRFADGTQVCWQKETLNVAITIASGNIYISDVITWTFPAVFNVDVKGVSCIADNAWVLYQQISSFTINQIQLCSSTPIQALRVLSWFAIGKWK